MKGVYLVRNKEDVCKENVEFSEIKEVQPLVWRKLKLEQRPNQRYQQN